MTLYGSELTCAERVISLYRIPPATALKRISEQWPLQPSGSRIIDYAHKVCKAMELEYRAKRVKGVDDEL